MNGEESVSSTVARRRKGLDNDCDEALSSLLLLAKSSARPDQTSPDDKVDSKDNELNFDEDALTSFENDKGLTDKVPTEQSLSVNRNDGSSTSLIPKNLQAQQRYQSELRPFHSNGLYNKNSAGNIHATNTTKTISVDDLRKHFHLPIAEVARRLHTCTTALKKICRKLQITKWPYRQILSLTKSIQSLEMASLNDALEPALRDQYRAQITVLQKTIGEVVRNPNKAIEHCNLEAISSMSVQEVADSSNELKEATGDALDEVDHDDEHLQHDSAMDELFIDQQDETEAGRTYSSFTAAPALHEISNNNNGSHNSASAEEKTSSSSYLPSSQNFSNQPDMKLSEDIFGEHIDDQLVLSNSLFRQGSKDNINLSRISNNKHSRGSGEIIAAGFRSDLIHHPDAAVERVIRAASDVTTGIVSNEDDGDDQDVTESIDKDEEETGGRRGDGGAVNNYNNKRKADFSDSEAAVAEEGINNEGLQLQRSQSKGELSKRKSSNSLQPLASITSLLQASNRNGHNDATLTVPLRSQSGNNRTSNNNTMVDLLQNRIPQSLQEVGQTIVHCDLSGDQQSSLISATGSKVTYRGPVQLAPLQRKKFQHPHGRRIVPLMEPDVGASAAIEFVPHTIISALRKTLAERSTSGLMMMGIDGNGDYVSNVLVDPLLQQQQQQQHYQQQLFQALQMNQQHQQQQQQMYAYNHAINQQQQEMLGNNFHHHSNNDLSTADFQLHQQHLQQLHHQLSLQQQSLVGQQGMHLMLGHRSVDGDDTVHGMTAEDLLLVGSMGEEDENES